MTYSHVRAVVYELVRYCFCPFFDVDFAVLMCLNSRIVIVDTWFHLSNLIRVYIGAERTSGVNFSGGSLGGVYTRLTVVLREPDFITTSRLALL